MTEPTGSRATYVYEVVVRGILLGRYPPGASLNRRDIAGSLGVSISPVNEAFAVLQNEGIISTVPRRGTFVASLDRRGLTELTIVRAALEAEAARAYCGEPVRAARPRLIELADRVDAAAPVTFDHLHADISFHRTLVALSGNAALKSILETVMTRSLLLAMEATMHGEASPGLSHRQFVDDLASATPETVGAVVRANVFSGKEGIIQLDGQPSTAETDTSLDIVLGAMQEAER